jgi:hypothetical protein
MDKLDKDLLERVGRALNIKLYEWQVNYILDIPMVLDMRITGRGTGKTLAYIIKLLFSNETPIEAYDMKLMWILCDDCHCGLYYAKWFCGYLLDVHKCLTSAGIKPRPVFLNEEEYAHYERMVNYEFSTMVDKQD